MGGLYRPRRCQMRSAAETVCRHCWAYTLTGLDADRCALVAVVDNSPLTRTGELLAVLAGRQVYSRDIRGALDRRDRFALPTPSREPVHASHDCEQPLPAAWLAPPPVTVTAAPRPEVEF